MTDDEIRDLFVRLADPIMGTGGWRSMTQALLEAGGADVAEVSAWVQKVGGRRERIQGPKPGIGHGGPRVERDYGVRYLVPPEALDL